MLSIAVASIVILTLGSYMPNVFAFTCTISYPDKCYAVHLYNPYFDVNGVKSTNKVLYMTGTAGTITGATWAILTDGTILESDWQEGVTSGANHYFVWGLNGSPQHTWGSPSDNTYYTFTVEDMNKDKVWNLSAGGITGGTYTAATSLTHKLKSGYEIEPSTVVTLREDDFKDMSYVYLSTWTLWNSASGVNNQFLNPNPFTPVLHVKYCGTGDENYYHSQHGPGSAPANCT